MHISICSRSRFQASILDMSHDCIIDNQLIVFGAVPRCIFPTMRARELVGCWRNIICDMIKRNESLVGNIQF